MHDAKEQVKNELLAVVKRYSDESDLTIREAIEAMHEAEEVIIYAAINAAADGAD